MTGNAGDPLDLNGALGWYYPPLRYRLGSQITQCTGESRRPTCNLFGFFTNLFHERMKAYLSFLRKHFFR